MMIMKAVHLRSVDLNLLVVFDALIAEGHVSRAHRSTEVDPLCAFPVEQASGVLANFAKLPGIPFRHTHDLVQQTRHIIGK